MKPLLFPLVGILVLSCNSQSQNVKSDELQLGRLDSNNFYSEYFKFHLEIDSSWYVLNREQLNELFRERKKMVKELSNKSSYVSNGIDILLSLTTDTVENMPHAFISSLDLATYPQIKTEQDYLNDYFRQVKETYKNAGVQISSSSIGQEKIDNKLFYTTLITIKADNFLAYQKRYSVRIKDKLLNLMTNYSSDNESNKCNSVLNSIKWN
jgi:hypothetical protein